MILFILYANFYALMDFNHKYIENIQTLLLIMVLLFSWILVIQNKKYDMTHLSFLYSLYGITIIEQLIIFPISYIWPRVIHSFSSLFYFRVKYSSVILALFQASSKQPKFFYPFPLFVCPRSPHCPYRPLSYPCPRFHFPCLPLALPLTPLSLVPIFVPVPWVSVHQVASILVSISNSSKLVDMIKGVRVRLLWNGERVMNVLFY